MLAWLLDPRGDHNQGSLFLCEFAAVIGLDVDPTHRCRGQRERVGTESIIDIMVWWEGDFLIFIENKVWSPEGEDQIDREFRDLRRAGVVLGVPEKRQFAVFLTPSGRTPTSGDPSKWISISYGTLAERFRALLPEVTDVKVGLVLDDWLKTVSDWG